MSSAAKSRYAVFQHWVKFPLFHFVRKKSKIQHSPIVRNTKKGLVQFTPSKKEWSFGVQPYFHVFVAERSDVGLWLRQRPFKLCVTILRRHSKAKTYEGGGKSKKGPKVTKRPFLRITLWYTISADISQNAMKCDRNVSMSNDKNL